MKKLILDYASWRCGDFGRNQLGEGHTRLLNDRGFMCCLGQFSLQLNPALTKEDIAGFGEPCEIQANIEPLSEIRDVDEYDEEDEKRFRNSQLALDAIAINDDESTTPEEKIRQLKVLFAGKGYEIEVVKMGLPKP